MAVDASGSIDADEFALQREGLAEAIAHPAVLAAIRSKPRGAIGVAMVEWGSPGGAATVVPWMRLTSATVTDVAAWLRDAPRSAQSWNAIGDAIVHATRLIAEAPFRAAERVIDVSGDGPDSRSLIPAPTARDAAVAAGITVNALAIELSPVTRAGEPLRAHYEREVIGGPGAFVMATDRRQDFARAMRAKLIREIAGRAAIAG
ncbi:MAG TPA: DUF1194 domain-containing protein [Acetobacteraceae bacterium]|nr:DUF1194 domain-containing protein [Acetobacteraceae bacterium]